MFFSGQGGPRESRVRPHGDGCPQMWRMAGMEISGGASDEALFRILWCDFQADEGENLRTGWRAAPVRFPSPTSIRGMAAASTGYAQIQKDFRSPSAGEAGA